MCLSWGFMEGCFSMLRFANTGKWSMFENEGRMPESVIMLLLFVMTKSRKLQEVSVCRVGVVINCVRLSDSIVSFSLVSKGVTPLWGTSLARYVFPALKSPNIIIVAGKKRCADNILSVKLSRKFSNRSCVRFGGK